MKRLFWEFGFFMTTKNNCPVIVLNEKTNPDLELAFRCKDLIDKPL